MLAGFYRDLAEIYKLSKNSKSIQKMHIEKKNLEECQV